MADKVLMKGNQAIAEAAVQANCEFYAGYPITPQNEIPEYMSKRMYDLGRVFIQSESELAAINMVFGASAAGARAMTSSSSPGISLKQEGISYIAAAELPCVIVNMVRGGPGLGNISGAQSDYFQSTRGGGHGDYRLIVLAPSSVQEAYDLTMNAFDLADIYRNPVMILGDGYLGQMIEPLELKEYKKPANLPAKDWALTGCKGRKPHVVKTLYLIPPELLIKHNIHLQEKYGRIKKEFCLYEEAETKDAELIIVAYGIAARVCKGAVLKARKEGIKVGLLRPITLWPFPEKIISDLADKAKRFLVVEMSMGQMVDDVRLAVNGKKPVEFFGNAGGWMPSSDMILDKIKELKL
ncbi:3-methyl-2-oxobutanoate dehydrogenase subunit VorB [Candidatus Woesearchaeota archaeon]|nr:3-methyl-2-oxobutanoate dehydrogenase subunit VorB [Candidatus Woesearchaeota archaeon]